MEDEPTTADVAASTVTSPKKDVYPRLNFRMKRCQSLLIEPTEGNGSTSRQAATERI